MASLYACLVTFLIVSGGKYFVTLFHYSSGASTQGGIGARCTITKIGGWELCDDNDAFARVHNNLLLHEYIYYFTPVHFYLAACFFSTLCVKKNMPDVFSYNSRKHYRIFIIFGRNITEKVGNQKMLYFPTSPN